MYADTGLLVCSLKRLKYKININTSENVCNMQILAVQLWTKLTYCFATNGLLCGQFGVIYILNCACHPFTI